MPATPLKLTLQCAKCKHTIAEIDVDPQDKSKFERRYAGSGIECPECKTTRGPIQTWDGATGSAGRGAVGKPSAGVPEAERHIATGDQPVDQRMQRRPPTVGTERQADNWKKDRAEPAAEARPVAADHEAQPTRRPAEQRGYNRQPDDWKTGGTAPATEQPASPPAATNPVATDPAPAGELMFKNRPISGYEDVQLQSILGSLGQPVDGDRDDLLARLADYLENNPEASGNTSE